MLGNLSKFAGDFVGSALTSVADVGNQMLPYPFRMQPSFQDDYGVKVTDDLPAQTGTSPPSEAYVNGNSAEQEARDDRTNFLDQLIGTFTGENQKVLQDLMAAAARSQYEYSERLSSTAYQRAVKDMKLAGLNPAVMFAGGSGSAASTPQVGIAQVATENQLISGISAAAQITNSLGNILKAISSFLPSTVTSTVLKGVAK